MYYLPGNSKSIKGRFAEMSPYTMKDYDHVVVWLDYFNKVLPRSKGRRLDRGVCVSDPTLKDLAEAVRLAGFEVAETNERARHPRRPYVPSGRSGYVTVPKTVPKTRVLYRIAPKLVRVAARKR